MAALDTLFATCPDDVAEQRRRDELLWYVAIPPLYLALSSFQQAQGDRGTIAVVVWETGAAATRWSHSRG